MLIAYIKENESAVGKEFFLLRKQISVSKYEDFLLENIDDVIKSDCEKVFYNLEGVTEDIGIPNGKLFDIGIFGHLINSEKRSYLLKDLAFDYSSHVLEEKIHPSHMTKVLDAIQEIQEGEIKKANGIELYEYTKRSLEDFLDIRENYFEQSNQKIEIPICKILSKMEKRGYW